MKFLLLPLLLVTGGAGWYAHDSAETPAPTAPQTTCPPQDCRVEVECLPDGSCRVTCRDQAGAEVCSQVVECSKPADCEPACPPRSCSR